MRTGFETVSVPDVISSIVREYPLSIGLFREVIQNAEDSGATVLYFVLDHRIRPDGPFVHPGLEDSSGPALLAFNNKPFSDSDWVHIQQIQNSSKKKDESKIGKYGQGFRILYHITDSPQILSDGKLLTFDPSHHAFEEGGLFEDISTQDQSKIFEDFLPEPLQSTGFSGTMIRLPLRSSATLSTTTIDGVKAIDTRHIRDLFDQFISSAEMDISLLFLSHLTSIEFYEINDQGGALLSQVRITREPESFEENIIATAAVNVQTHRAQVVCSGPQASATDQAWRIVHVSFPESIAEEFLSKRVSHSTSAVLSKNKLSSKVALAFPLGNQTNRAVGHLFTFLPLSIPTGFPCHVHGLFALKQNRRGLKYGDLNELSITSEDRIFIEWNNFLFNELIPSAWGILLSTLLAHRECPSQNIFQSWPPQQPLVPGSDSEFRHTMPYDILRVCLRDGRQVWPVFRAVFDADEDRFRSLPPDIFADIGSVLATGEANPDDERTNSALAITGLPLTCLPSHIFSQLKKDECQIMTPASVHRYLRSHPNRLSSIHNQDAVLMSILGYLLSTNDIGNIVDIPIIPLARPSHYVALVDAEPAGEHSQEVYTLLEEYDTKLFGDFAPHAVPLHVFPSAIAKLLISHGPGRVNVTILTQSIVNTYLEHVFENYGLHLLGRAVEASVVITPDAMSWLVLFWEWLSNHRQDFLELIRSYQLIPTANGKLRSLTDGVYSLTSNLDSQLQHVLESFGIFFLHPDFPICAREFLETKKLIRSVTDAHSILESFVSTGTNIDERDARCLLKHMESCLSNDSRHLTSELKQKLRAMPIFPVLTPQMGGKVQEISSLQQDNIIRAIAGTIWFVPLVDGFTFLDDIGRLVEHLGARIQNEEVLTLAVKHLTTQPDRLKQAIVEHIARNRDEVPNSLLSSLKKIPLIPSGDGPLRSACDLFDPDCRTAKLLGKDPRCACPSTDVDHAILSCLRSLGLLKYHPDREVIEERIRFISQTPDDDVAVGKESAHSLIQLLAQSEYDCSKLSLDVVRRLRWLPTKQGLAIPDECHHTDSGHPSELFNDIPSMVVDVPEGGFTSTLIAALGWTDPIPLQLVTRQFEQVVESRGGFAKLFVLVKEIGSRASQLSPDDCDALRKLTGKYPWIPISQNCIATTKRVTLSPDAVQLPGFHIVPSLLTENTPVRNFLVDMGCEDSPSLDTLISELHALGCTQETKSAKQALQLLRAIADMELNEFDRSRLLIPDESEALRRFGEVYFDDLDPSTRPDVCLPEDKFKVHPTLDFDLAKRLMLTFLGHLELKRLIIDEKDMGEPLPVRIQGVLLQYGVSQTISEFLANADDAGSREFRILLDETVPSQSTSTMSPALKEAQSHPSVIIYNDAVFEDEDFEGIVNIGIGGKDDRSNTIGQFGLGSLSMYHFSETVMIISGKKVLFLDPCQKYLPFRGRRSSLMWLSDIKSRYPDHLTHLHGLYGFSKDSDEFNGTIFKMPLTDGSNELAPKSLSAHEIASIITDFYDDVAPQALYFTKLDHIIAEHRDVRGQRDTYWSIEGTRTETNSSVPVRLRIELTRGKTQSTEEWYLMNREFDRESRLPPEFHTLIQSHRLRDPIVTGLAANITGVDSRHKLFAALPLPILTQLPVHINASFILGPDRRSVRFDGDGEANLESKYNKWLLSELLPSLYFDWLDYLVHKHHGNSMEYWTWWPGYSYMPQDTLSNTLIESFYGKHVKETDKSICQSASGKYIVPREATFLVKSSGAIQKILSILSPDDLVHIPQGLYPALKGRIRTVDAHYVRNLVLREADSVKTAYRNSDLSVADIQEVVKFLLAGELPVDDLKDLPLLPLADNTLTTFDPTAGCYITWTCDKKNADLFPLGRLVHSQFSVAGLEGLNVSKITLDGMSDLAAKMGLFSERQRDNLCDNDIARIASFLSEFKRMPLKPEAEAIDRISHFALVPTTIPGSYISLDKCRDADVIISNQNSEIEKELGLILSRLDLLVVDRNSKSCHTILGKVLRGEQYNHLSVTAILPFLSSVDPHCKRFSRLSLEQKSRFASWAQQDLCKIPPEHLPVARQLPIWRSLDSKDEVIGRFLAAHDVVMLPDDISGGYFADILRFLRDPSHYVEYSSILQNSLQIQPITFSDFLGRIAPTRKTLPTSDIAPYKRLVQMIINRGYRGDHEILIPNGRRILVNVRKLYARSSEPLFLAAFRTRPQLLIHEEYQDLEHGLESWGLRNKMDFYRFKECVKCIIQDRPDGHFEIAKRLSQWYTMRLPLASLAPQQWRELDSLRFIPVTSFQKSVSYDRARRARPSREGDLVSPGEVFLPKFEAIIWSQRSPFSPSDGLCIADQKLGVPLTAEVLKHLRCLAIEVAPEFPANQDLLSDIKDTYQWLLNHICDEGFGDELLQYQGDRLFLNVDDPEKEEWVWRSADELCFNIDDMPDSNCWNVRKFLEPFEALLRLAEVEAVEAPSIPALPAKSLEIQYIAMRKAFDEMRIKGQLTDVKFVAEDGEESFAHRAFLAATTEHFQSSFCGYSRESGPATVAEPVILNLEYSGQAIKCALQYLYTGDYSKAQSQDAEQLLDILRLAHFWNVEVLLDEVQVDLINYITLENYAELRENVEQYDAFILVHACDEFEEKNRDTIRRFNDRA